VEFSGQAGKLFQGTEEYNQNYYLITKYNSKVDFTETVCINTNTYQVYNPGCEVQNRNTYSGQGAPVAITQMDELVTPGSGAAVEFRFRIENKGSSMMGGSEGRVGRLNLNDARLGNEQLFCKFVGSSDAKSVVMGNNQEILVCKKPVRELNSFTTTLVLSLSYDYEVTQEMQLTISNNPSKGLFS